jgi:hypothetical protein
VTRSTTRELRKSIRKKAIMRVDRILEELMPEH